MEGMKRIILSSKNDQEDIRKETFIYLQGHDMTVSKEGQTYLNLNDNAMVSTKKFK